MNQENELPLGWETVLLKDVAEIIRGVTFSKDAKAFEYLPDYVACLRTTNVQKEVEWDDLWYVPANIVKRDEQFIEIEDILISTANSYELVGKVALIKHIPSKSTLGAFISVIRIKNSLNKRFFYYQISWQEFQKKIRSLASTTTNISNVSTDKIKTLSVLFPPLLEQHRIVTEIEKQFSRLDEAIAALKRSQANIKRYKASVLKSAVEGKLTENWRKQHPAQESAGQLLERILKERRAQWEAAELQKMLDNGKPPKDDKWKLKYKEPVKPELADLPELPEGWVWVPLIAACEAVVDCHNKTAPYEVSGIPLIRTSSIRDMKLNFDNSIRFVSEETYKFWSRRCPPKPRDILFTREAPMGEAAIIPDDKIVCMGQRIMLFRVDKHFLLEKYLLYSVQNPIFKKIIDIVAVGTGVKHLRVGDVEKLPIPICSIEEQAQIVAEVEKRLSIAEEVEQQINANLKRAEYLRQAILKKAFSGKLVPQDPTEESCHA